MKKPVVGWFVGWATLLVVAALALRYHVPPAPPAVDLRVTFSAQPVSAGEPLFVTGEPGDGDFIHVHYLDATHLAFGYDRWGVGGPMSDPVPYQPGTAYDLRIESPSLWRIRGTSRQGADRVCVTFNGTTVLDTTATFALRGPNRAWFGENPNGGTSCGPKFSGVLSRANGRPLHGSIRGFFSFGERAWGWLRWGAWQIAATVFLATAAGWSASRIARAPAGSVRAWLTRYRPGPHRWFITSAAVCLLIFGWLITGGNGQIFYRELFGDFYDYQAAALLQGRLDVPEPAISGEAFVVDGKYYGYFGVTPALLRLPFVIFDLEWACLSRALMLAYYLGCLAAAYAQLRHATRRLRGPDALPSAPAVVLFTLGTGLGTTFLFLGSRAYLYHEATLCGALFALWTAWFALRWLADPASRTWLGALLCGCLAVHSRPTSGLFALTLLGVVAVAVALDQRSFRRPLAVALLALAGVLSFNGMSYLKFGTFDGSPFKYAVQYTPERRARFNDRNFHLANLEFNSSVYLWRPSFKVQPNFPWFLFSGGTWEAIPGTKNDLAEEAIALPYAMSWLCLLVTGGGVLACVRSPSQRRELVVLWLAVAPAAAALFTAIVTSHRYTADFCPFLISAGACGIATVDTLARGARAIAWAALGLLLGGSFAVTLLFSLRFQGDKVWGVPAETKARYAAIRAAADGFFGVAPP